MNAAEDLRSWGLLLGITSLAEARSLPDELRVASNGVVRIAEATLASAQSPTSPGAMR